MLADNSPVMEQANETVDVMLQDPKERWLYENRMKYEHDKASWEHFGYTKGVEAGITQGAHQNKLETAKNLLDMKNVRGLNFSIWVFPPQRDRKSVV